MTDREKFYQVVNRFDCLRPYWDQVNHRIRKENLDNRMETMSSGELHLAEFMAAVWFHDNKYSFDLIDAMGTLGGDFRQVVIDWVTDPYWP